MNAHTFTSIHSITLPTLLEGPTTFNKAILDLPQNEQAAVMHYGKIMLIRKISFQHYTITSVCQLNKKKRYFKFSSYTNIHLLITTTAYIMNLK
jgi:hypothetical protein